MKKDEALELAFVRSQLVIEYLDKILAENDKIEGLIDFTSYKIEGKHMCTIDIYVPSQGFERHLNTGITSDHCDIFYEQLFNDILDNYLEHEFMGPTKYYSIKYGMGENFTGINVVNAAGGKVKLNFIRQGQKFDEICHNYNKRIDEYKEKIQGGSVKR